MIVAAESLTRMLREQQTLNAVERFSREHDTHTGPAQAKYYRDLIPLERPRPGQQYAFEVDLDACTGCKACVTACHSLNGLEDTELWRTVGVLHGGTAAAPAQQTVTTACHHCVEPACMSGCPVGAYEKDPVTGIVKHLDDQCIGCQYCTLMCPYDAPKYSKAKGIVRKCDMCSDRLSASEAPACVQGCPNEAIRIKVIDQAQAVEASEAGIFLPGAPAPDHTIPTTVYRGGQALPGNMLPADFYTVAPEHGHPPLVAMLVMTQLAVGAFVVNFLLGRLTNTVQAALSLALAIGAMGAATLHLGRPVYAFRAVLGLRTSWMSREILAFGLFAKMAALYAVSVAGLPAFPGRDLIVELRPIWQIAAVACGLGGVFCSAMIYAATKRVHWSAPVTLLKFFATTLVLGSAVVMALGGASPLLAQAVLIAAGVKLMAEASVFRHLGSRRQSIGKRVAMVMARDLRQVTLLRFIAGAIGAVVLTVAPWVAFGLLLVGESAERHLFFKAAPASRMPGSLS